LFIRDSFATALSDHYSSTYASARSIWLEIPISPEELARAVEETLKVNGLVDAYIRVVVTRGAGSLGLDPRKTTDPQVIIITDSISLYPPELYEHGLSRTFQIAQEFTHLTALENLMVVTAGRGEESFFDACFRRGKIHADELAARRKAEEILQVLRLTHVKNEQAGNLSGGQKKLLELGRVMMADPRVVLLDEVAAGVNRTLLNDLASVVESLNHEKGLTFFVIEHDMDLIARLCDPVIVMAAGKVMVQGPMADIRKNPEVIEAYFGGAPAERAS
jgi:branched-chain amino acid transport system ATP-binding protein